MQDELSAERNKPLLQEVHFVVPLLSLQTKQSFIKLEHGLHKPSGEIYAPTASLQLMQEATSWEAHCKQKGMIFWQLSQFVLQEVAN